MTQGRDSSGRFEPKVRDQDVLKVLDFADEPMLSAPEIADGLHTHFDIDVTAEGIRNRLHRMEDEDLVASKEFGARAIGWYALVAPKLASDVAETVQNRRDTDRDEFVSLDS